MLVITIAHHREAQRIIEHYRLKSQHTPGAKKLFESDTIRLVVSGTGVVNAAIATTLAFASLHKDLAHGALNFGTCAAQRDLEVGTIYRVNQVKCLEHDRYFYPDMILRLNMEELNLETRATPYIKEESPPLNAALVDMEASGFFEAARTFVEPSRIIILKMVSDHGDSYREVSDHIDQQLDRCFASVRESIDTIIEWLGSRRALSQEHNQSIDAIRCNLSLTLTQTQQLGFLCRARLPSGDLDDILDRYQRQNAADRASRNRIYGEIVDALTLSLV